MLNDFIEQIIPRSEFIGESPVNSVRYRENDLVASLEVIGLAVSAMLGGVQERVETLAHHYDAVLDPNIVALSRSAADIRNEEITRRLALGNDLGLNPGAPEDIQEIVAKNDDMAKVLRYSDKEFSLEGARENLSDVLNGTKVPFEPLATEPLKTVESQRQYSDVEQRRISELRAQLAALESKAKIDTSSTLDTSSLLDASNDQFAITA